MKQIDTTAQVPNEDNLIYPNKTMALFPKYLKSSNFLAAGRNLTASGMKSFDYKSAPDPRERSNLLCKGSFYDA